MSNKQRLDTANTRFDSVLLNMIDQLVEVKSDTGLYVWKKCEYSPQITVENPAFHVEIPSAAGNTECVVTLSASNFNFSLLPESSESVKYITEDFLLNFFDDFHDTDRKVVFYNDNGTLMFTHNSTVYNPYKFKPLTETTAQFSLISGSLILSRSTDCSYTGTKLLKEEGIEEEFEYIVSDNENAYPDGGVHTDGYWYEKAGGESGVEFGEVSVTLADGSPKTITVAHTLGVIPSYVALLPKSFSTGGNLTYACINNEGIYYSSSRLRNTDITNTLTETEITFSCVGSYGFYQTDYYWIAIV